MTDLVDFYHPSMVLSKSKLSRQISVSLYLGLNDLMVKIIIFYFPLIN